MSAYEAGRQLGYVAFPIVVLGVAAYLGSRMGQKRQPPKFVAWPVGVAALLLVISFLGIQMKKQAETPPPFSETR